MYLFQRSEDLQNRLHPYYLVYVSNEGDIVANHFEVKRLLDLIRSSCKGQTAPLSEICALFNRLTQDGRDMQRYSHLLTDAIKSMVEVKEEKDIDSLFSGGATSALVNTFAELDDFELLAFIVIQQKQFIDNSAQDEVS